MKQRIKRFQNQKCVRKKFIYSVSLLPNVGIIKSTYTIGLKRLTFEGKSDVLITNLLYNCIHYHKTYKICIIKNYLQLWYSTIKYQNNLFTTYTIKTTSI